MVYWSLSNSKSPQVSRTLLSILADLNIAVVWMDSTRPRTSKSSSTFNNPLVTVPKAPFTIGIIVTFMFRCFLNSLVLSRYLSFFSHSFSFILRSAVTEKSPILQILFLLLNKFMNLPIGLLVLFTNPSARAGYDTRSVFKRSLTGLNSEIMLQNLMLRNFLFHQRYLFSPHD